MMIKYESFMETLSKIYSKITKKAIYVKYCKGEYLFLVAGSRIVVIDIIM